ncbi:MAG: hypothetical protein GY809_07405 [Planctomycetes bacterium]|nr:hypothetical protein [Planctomycetota bacterium]
MTDSTDPQLNGVYAAPPDERLRYVSPSEFAKQAARYEQWLATQAKREQAQGGAGGTADSNLDGDSADDDGQSIDQLDASDSGTDAPLSDSDMGLETPTQTEGETANSTEGETMPKKRRDSGKAGVFNVYARSKYGDRNGKLERLNERTEAESPQAAIEATKRQMMQAGTLTDYQDFEARRQRGKAMADGADSRRGKGREAQSGTEAAQDDFDGQSDGQGQASTRGKQTSEEMPQDDASGASDESAESQDGEGQGQDGEQGTDDSDSPDDDLILHRMSDGPLVGTEATKRISDIAGSHMDRVLEVVKLALDNLPTQQEQAVDEAAVEAIVQKALQGWNVEKTVTVNVETADGKTIDSLDGEHFHPMFPEICDLVSKREPVYLWGPSGAGKTFTASQVARAFFPADEDCPHAWQSVRTEFRGIEHMTITDEQTGEERTVPKFAFLSLSGGTSESHIQGYLLPSKTGEFVHVSTHLLDVFEYGGLALLDELDRMPPDVGVLFNALFEQGRMPLPQRMHKPYVDLHPETMIMAAGNTCGTGADRLYSAAQQQDEAVLERFRYGTRHFDYDKGLEKQLCGGETPLLRALWKVREKATAGRAEVVISTRYAIKCHKYGDSIEKALTVLSQSWDESKRSMLGINELIAQSKTKGGAA